MLPGLQTKKMIKLLNIVLIFVFGTASCNMPTKKPEPGIEPGEAPIIEPLATRARSRDLTGFRFRRTRERSFTDTALARSKICGLRSDTG